MILAYQCLVSTINTRSSQYVAPPASSSSCAIDYRVKGTALNACTSKCLSSRRHANPSPTSSSKLTRYSCVNDSSICVSLGCVSLIQKHNISPYKDDILIAAQVFAVLAFVLSLTGISGAVLSLVTVVLFLSTCCCSMNKCGLITAGVFGILTTLTLILFAVAIPMNLKANEAELRDTYGDTNYEAIYSQFRIRVILMSCGAGLWAIASLLVFAFACSSRYQRVVQSYEQVVAVIV